MVRSHPMPAKQGPSSRPEVTGPKRAKTLELQLAASRSASQFVQARPAPFCCSQQARPKIGEVRLEVRIACFCPRA